LAHPARRTASADHRISVGDKPVTNQVFKDEIHTFEWATHDCEEEEQA